MTKKYLIPTVLIIMFLTISPIAAMSFEEEISTKHEFQTDGFIFQYNDHNSTVYEGDLGLQTAECVNKIDNTTLILPTERVRGMAYATKGTFKFDDSIYITRSIQRDDGKYILLRMFRKDGTEMISLDISDTGLTAEQRSYFEDYAQQKADYNAQQEEFALDHIYNYQRYESSKSKSHYSYYMGSGGSGFIYTP